ncbi:hypothetical protein EV183_004090 [Coemansia sp. RSA 2336]|nr:hypothetical protein EV183_004090 [Coemansia sp. RSA 2336]
MCVDICRGYLPTNYYSDRLVFRRKPPSLSASLYPNKIEIDAQRSFAIVAKHASARLSDIYEWMAAHPYIQVRYVGFNALFTGNIAIEAYTSAERSYAMVIFRAATTDDEHTNRMLESHGESRKGPCPPPTTGLLCRSGVNIQSVWQWLSLHSGRIAYLINEPFLHTNIAIVPNTRLQAHAGQQLHLLTQSSLLRSNSNARQADSIDSGLPTYETSPPSIGEPTLPEYWDIVQETPYGRNSLLNLPNILSTQPLLLLLLAVDGGHP